MYMGKFGSGSPKRHRLLSNDEELLKRIQDRAGYMSRDQQSQCSTKLVKKYIDKRGQSRCVGLKKELRESAHLAFLRFQVVCYNQTGMISLKWSLNHVAGFKNEILCESKALSTSLWWISGFGIPWAARCVFGSIHARIYVSTQYLNIKISLLYVKYFYICT